MKKLLLCSYLLALPGMVLPAFAQKLPPKSIGKALAKTAILRPTKGAIASITAGLTDKQLEQVILKLQAENAALERQIAQQQTLQEHAYSVARKGVFRAVGPQSNTLTFSGTLFKTVYNGQEEIYGVVPMHILKNAQQVPGTLSYKFTAGVLTEHTVKFIPAWVVALSSSKTADVALVKFRKEDEKLLSPLSVSTQTPVFPQQAYAQGFACNLMARQAFQLIGTTSTGMLTAQIPAARSGERAGYCGSPVVNENGQLSGIHVGSRYVANSPQEDAFFSAFQLNRPQVQEGDIGYVAPVSFLQQLVAAYHHPALKPQTVSLGGKEITRLAINEYVSRLELLNANKQVIWSKNMDFKVSFSAAETVLQLRNKEISFIRLHIGRTHWVKEQGHWQVEDTPGVSSVLYAWPAEK